MAVTQDSEITPEERTILDDCLGILSKKDSYEGTSAFEIVRAKQKILELYSKLSYTGERKP